MTQPSPHRAACILLLTFLIAPFQAGAQQYSASSSPARVSFLSGSVTLGGTVYKPQGEGPFPAVVYNHGHLAAYDWLKRQSFVDADRIATARNSFGGIITLLAAKQVRYCAAVDAAGGAENWSSAVVDGMIEAARQARAPVFLFQAANDYSLEPTQRLGEEMRRARRAYEAKIYPAFGSSRSDRHSLAWQGSAVWSEDVFRFLNTHCG
jgi:dienelactone hydrolase